MKPQGWKTASVKRLLLLPILVFLPLSAFGQTDVLTQHNDDMRTGQNISESVLTPSNVNSTAFGKLLSLPTDGFRHAERDHWNGAQVLTNFDIVAVAGAPFTALDQTFPVTVADRRSRFNSFRDLPTIPRSAPLKFTEESLVHERCSSIAEWLMQSREA